MHSSNHGDAADIHNEADDGSGVCRMERERDEGEAVHSTARSFEQKTRRVGRSNSSLPPQLSPKCRRFATETPCNQWRLTPLLGPTSVAGMSKTREAPASTVKRTLTNLEQMKKRESQLKSDRQIDTKISTRRHTMSDEQTISSTASSHHLCRFATQRRNGQIAVVGRVPRR